MRAIVVLGAPRSGTTLVYRSLCLHPDALWLSNWLRRVPSFHALAVGNRVARRVPDVRRRAWFPGGNAYVYGRPRPIGERAFPAPVEGEPVFRRWGFSVDAAAPGDRDLARSQSALRSLARWGGGSVLVTKRIDHNRRIPVLEQALPSPRYVVVQRDGRAVAASLAKVDWWEDADLWWHGGTPATWRAEGRDPWEACARHWVEEVSAIEEGLAGVDPDRVRRLAYEDLLVDPAASIAGIARFGGLVSDVPWWDRALEHLPNHGARDPAGPNLPPRALDTIEQIAGPELARLGYLA